MVFFNFFAIFLEFSITRRVGTKRNDKFYILSFSAFSNLFWLEMMRHWYFWIFLLLFWNFLLRVRLERNVMIIFIFSLSHHFPLILAWNEAIMVFLKFLNFFAIFLEFSISSRVGTKRNDNFYVSHSRHFPTYFRLK